MSHSQPPPLYEQLKARLVADIRAGRFGPDGRIPTEQELCEEFGLSRTPVARALTELAQEGIVLRQRRRGTFVNPAWASGAAPAEEEQETADLTVLATGTVSVDHLRTAAAGAAVRPRIRTVRFDELHAAFLRAIAEGRGPDLAVLDSVWVAEFARAGFLTPLEDLDADGWLANEYTRDLLPPFSHRFGGRTPAVHAPADVTGLWYRRETFERLGLRAPRTWEELRATGRLLAGRRPGSGHVLVMPGGRRAGEETTYALTGLLAANGALVLGEGGEVVLDSPAAAETMRLVRELIADEVLSPDVAGFGKDEAVKLLAAGRAEMCVGASYQAGALAKVTRLSLDQVHSRFGFAPMPRGPEGRSAVMCGGMVYVIPRQARHPEAAMRLLRAAMAPDALVRLCLITGQLPPRRTSLQAAAAVSAFHAQTAALLDRAVLRPVSPVYALVSAQLQVMIEEVLRGERGPAAAVARTADLIRAVTMAADVTRPAAG
ncbi:extracellular solute-binding protein [Nonomuraea turcica]|uniref:extracellular solute-binding protein n=1 Tax=Nonomuraea sp. G32 TaxID=3067274 RepID=UPI00273CC0BC|nr:extracellular solute-binding protein [Nonomuraea sp. G32]MDP4502626.1 extracellular solute-binding protein [Nonomuraea sp. G32]